MIDLAATCDVDVMEHAEAVLSCISDDAASPGGSTTFTPMSALFKATLEIYRML